MRHPVHKHVSIWDRCGFWLRFGVLGLFCGLVALAWFVTDRRYVGPTTIVLATDPILIWSLNKKNNSSILISLPKTLVIEAVAGFGTYSLEGLWRLDNVEKKSGLLFTQSLEQAIGLPISYYLGYKDELISSAAGKEIDVAKLALSQVRFWSGSHKLTNINWWIFLELWWRFGSMSSDMQFINIAKSTTLAEQKLPDGSTVRVIDPGQIDRLFGQRFEDELVRQERVSVGVYNTTKVPTLAGRVARILERVGVVIVTVGNAEPEVADKCVLAGNKDSLHTKTAQVIGRVLGCRLEIESLDRVDLAVRLGRDYARHFK